MSKLVLIDSMAILYRAYFALPPLTTKKGEPINAVYGLVSMLIRIIQDLKPTHIIACFDMKAPNFRMMTYEKYQSQRPPVPLELEGQFEKAKDTFDAIGIPWYGVEGYEADDLIGTISEKSKENIEEVIIVTGDRDQYQLVDEKVKLYMPIVGLSSAKLMGQSEVKEKMGVAPSQIVDYKGLVGDPSDNYFGVPGIGPKTAVNLLEKYNSFEGIYSHLDEIKPAVKEKLVKEKESAELSYKLALIIRDVAFDFDLESAKKWRIDSDAVLELFENKYGFKTLTKRVKEVGKQIVSENQTSLF